MARWLWCVAALMAATPLQAADARDPYAVCKASPDLDQPVTAERVSRQTLTRMAKALDLDIPARELPGMRKAFYWRCMHGDVYVCYVGANIPCWDKADTRRTNEGATRWCAEHPDDDMVPAYATGHETVWLWGCAGSQAVIRKTDVQLDPRGFLVQQWSRLEPPTRKR
jgi:hypothetical protein